LVLYRYILLAQLRARRFLGGYAPVRALLKRQLAPLCLALRQA
jgi:hypothetical protein